MQPIVGDEQAFSDPESVREDDAGNVKEKQAKPKVVIQLLLPPEGITNSSKTKPLDPPLQQDQCSSIASRPVTPAR